MTVKTAKPNSEPTTHELFNLTGRVALITGATGHLGQSLARALAEAGASVITASRDQARAQAIADNLPRNAEANQNHFAIALDHMDEQSIEYGFTNALNHTGHIDILVNNAHEPRADPWDTVTAKGFNRQLANTTGYFLLARHLHQHATTQHAQRNSASIIMLGSMYGQVGSYPDAYEDIAPPSPAAYHALKGGIIHLTRHLAVYWAKDNVRVNCLSPGPFPSPKANPEMVKRLIAKSPMSRMGQPHELKGSLLLLASDAGSYITGQNLVVDGGWTAW